MKQRDDEERIAMVVIQCILNGPEKTSRRYRTQARLQKRRNNSSE